MKGEPSTHFLPTPLGPLLSTQLLLPSEHLLCGGNECPAGHYCPTSTSFASQFPCPRGTYKPQRGCVQQSDCTRREPGKGEETHSCPSHIRPYPSWPARAGLWPGSDGGALATAHSANQISPHLLMGEVPPSLHPPLKIPRDPVFSSPLQVPTLYCLSWQQGLGPAVQGSTALGDRVSQIPWMGSQETPALQATSVPRPAPGLLRAPQVSHRLVNTSSAESVLSS